MRCGKCAGLTVEEQWAEVGSVWKCLNCGWVKLPVEPKHKCHNGKCPNPQQVDSVFCTRCHPLLKYRGEPSIQQHVCGEASRLARKARHDVLPGKN